MPSAQLLDSARIAIAQFPIEDPRIELLEIGLINRTFKVTARDGTRFILQKLSTIHAPRVNDDIAAVTARLTGKGLPTPVLIPSRGGTRWVEIAGDVWRMLSFIDGETRVRLQRPAEAESTGRVLAGFHLALLDYQATLQSARLGVHDFDHHIGKLRTALATHQQHPRYSAVLRLGEAILHYARTLPPLPPLPDRVVHGDPKITNFIFQYGTDTALCLIDLDTLARMPLPLEIGDALRSWCNPNGEDDPNGRFDVDMLNAAITGYAAIARRHITAEEWRAFIPATERIFVELAARFCADALNENYFGWNPARFASRSEHNSVRAAGQLSAAKDLAAQRKRSDAIIAAAFAG